VLTLPLLIQPLGVYAMVRPGARRRYAGIDFLYDCFEVFGELGERKGSVLLWGLNILSSVVDLALVKSIDFIKTDEFERDWPRARDFLMALDLTRDLHDLAEVHLADNNEEGATATWKDWAAVALTFVLMVISCVIALCCAATTAVAVSTTSTTMVDTAANMAVAMAAAALMETTSATSVTLTTTATTTTAATTMTTTAMAPNLGMQGSGSCSGKPLPMSTSCSGCPPKHMGKLCASTSHGNSTGKACGCGGGYSMGLSGLRANSAYTAGLSCKSGGIGGPPKEHCSSGCGGCWRLCTTGSTACGRKTEAGVCHIFRITGGCGGEAPQRPLWCDSEMSWSECVAGPELCRKLGGDPGSYPAHFELHVEHARISGALGWDGAEVTFEPMCCGHWTGPAWGCQCAAVGALHGLVQAPATPAYTLRSRLPMPYGGSR